MTIIKKAPPLLVLFGSFRALNYVLVSPNCYHEMKNFSLSKFLNVYNMKLVNRYASKKNR